MELSKGIQITASYPIEHLEEQAELHVDCMEKFQELFGKKENINAAIILTLNYFIA